MTPASKGDMPVAFFVLQLNGTVGYIGRYASLDAAERAAKEDFGPVTAVMPEPIVQEVIRSGAFALQQAARDKGGAK